MFHKLRIKFLEASEKAIWKGHAKHFGAHEFNISDIQVVCSYGRRDFVKEAFQQIEDFDSALWTRLSDAVKMIIFVEQGDSGIIPGKGIVRISIKDQSHISTPTHLASWLLYYSEKLHGVKEVGIVSWYKKWNSEVETRAKNKRSEFLSGPKMESA